MKVYTYFNKQRIREDGSIPIYIVVYRSPKRLFIHTGLSSKTEFPDCIFPRSERNYKAKSIALQKYLEEVEKVALDNSLLSNEELKAIIMNTVFGRPTFDNVLVSLLKKYAETKNGNTPELYNRTAIKVEEFDKYATLNINVAWLKRFYDYERAKGNTDNTIAIHLRNIRRVMNWAIENEWSDNYPFKKFKIPTEQTKKRNISIDTLRFLFDCDLPKKHLEKYRDIFKIMFYLIGINAVDLLTARKEQVIDGRLEYKRAKTGKLYSIKIEPEAQELIDRYAGKELLLKFGEKAKYRSVMAKADLYLKDIVPGISTYYARHSWATIASDIDIPIDTISAALGHSHGSEVTNIYINFDQKKVDTANRKVIDYVLGVDVSNNDTPT